jgi:hypothetical protein
MRHVTKLSSLGLVGLITILPACGDDDTTASSAGATDTDTDGTTGSSTTASSTTASTTATTSASTSSTTDDTTTTSSTTDDTTTSSTTDDTTTSSTTDDTTTSSTTDDTSTTGTDTDADECPALENFQVVNLDGVDDTLFGIFSTELGNPDGMGAPPFDQLQVEFYNNPPGGVGTFDFATAPNDNYGTCVACPLLYVDATQTGAGGFYYATAGTLEITAQPIANDVSQSAGTFTGVQLREVTLDQTTFQSTLVPGGDCVSIPDGTFDLTPPAVGPRIRVVHASPDAGPVDIFEGGAVAGATPLIDDLDYKSATDYIQLPAGTTDITVDLYAGGAAPGGPTAPIALPFTGLADDSEYTIIAAGLVGSAGANAFRTIVVAEDFSGANGTTEIGAVVVHAGADAPRVALDVADNSVDGTGLELLLDTDFSFGATTPAVGLPLPINTALPLGIWTVDDNGTAGDFSDDSGDDRVTAITAPPLGAVFEPAGGVIVIATGLLADPINGETGFTTLAVGQDDQGATVIAEVGQNATLYALHASSRAPAVDIYVAPTGSTDPAQRRLLIGGLAFRGFTPLGRTASVTPGTYDILFFAAGGDPTGAPAARQDGVAIPANARALAIAAGELAPNPNEPAFQVNLVVDDFTAPAAGTSQVIVSHSAAAPEVDVGVFDVGGFSALGGEFNALEFGERAPAAGSAEVAAGDTVLGLQVTGSAPATQLAFDVVTVPDGGRLIIAASGDVDGEFGERLALAVVAATGPSTADLIGASWTKVTDLFVDP